MRQHSKEAWDVASKFADALASETRDLAACIDVALAAERERCAAHVEMLAVCYSGTEPVALVESRSGEPMSKLFATAIRNLNSEAK